jgi:hypothetical protein
VLLAFLHRHLFWPVELQQAVDVGEWLEVPLECIVVHVVQEVAEAVLVVEAVVVLVGELVKVEVEQGD